MSRPLLLALALAVAAPACSLIANPNDHVGGTRDAGSGDAARDTGDGHVGPIDGGPDAWAPPECNTATDCGPGGAAGLVQCLAQRCVFCAAPSEPTPYVLRSGTGLRPYVSLGTRRRSTGPTLVLVGTMGTTSAAPALAHNASIDAPSSAVAVQLAAGIAGGCSGTVDSVSSMSFYPDDQFPSSTDTAIAVVVDGPTGRMITHLTWPNTSGAIMPAGFTCRTLMAPSNFTPASTFFRAPDTTGNSPLLQLTRQSTGTGSAFVAYSYPYATQSAFYTSFGGPLDDYAPMTSAGPFMVIGAASTTQVLWWDPEITSGGPSLVMTPERTGDPSVVALGTATMAGELLHFTMAFPVMSRVRFVNVDCDTSCMPVGQSVDLHTDATTVTAARLGMAGSVQVLLTSERLASGAQQVVLRVMRANGTPYDAPGGGHALVLATAASGSVVSDIELAVVNGATVNYAAVWMITSAAGMSSVQLQTFQGSCAH